MENISIKIFLVLLPGRPGGAALLVCARYNLKTGPKVRSDTFQLYDMDQQCQAQVDKT